MGADLGGTSLLAPLQEILTQPLLEGFPRNVVVLTDGGVGDTESVLALVERHCHVARSSCIGIGQGASQALVKGIGVRGKGEHSLLSVEDDLKAKVVDMLLNLSSPVIERFRLKFDDALFEEVLPNPLSIPYIQKNEPVNFYLKLRRPAGDEDRVLFEYRNSYTGAEEKAELALAATLLSEDVRRLFSFRKIRLMENVARSSQPKSLMLRDWASDLKQDIVQESVAAQILSEHTAWLAVLEGD